LPTNTTLSADAVKEPQVLLSDFGMCKIPNGHASYGKTFVTSYQIFMPLMIRPPENLETGVISDDNLKEKENKKKKGTYSMATDVWAIGFILFSLFSEKYHFYGNQFVDDDEGKEYDNSVMLYNYYKSILSSSLKDRVGFFRNFFSQNVAVDKNIDSMEKDQEVMLMDLISKTLTMNAESRIDLPTFLNHPFFSSVASSSSSSSSSPDGEVKEKKEEKEEEKEEKKWISELTSKAERIIKKLKFTCQQVCANINNNRGKYNNNSSITDVYLTKLDIYNASVETVLLTIDLIYRYIVMSNVAADVNINDEEKKKEESDDWVIVTTCFWIAYNFYIDNCLAKDFLEACGYWSLDELKEKKVADVNKMIELQTRIITLFEGIIYSPHLSELSKSTELKQITNLFLDKPEAATKFFQISQNLVNKVKELREKIAEENKKDETCAKIFQLF
jgi:hypothetical protein